MKGKRYATEEKIRALREVDGGKPIREMCQEKNISEATYHRWRKQFGLMEVDEAKRLKELERENTELKKMLAESLLKNRVLEAVCEKSSEPGGAPGGSEAAARRGSMLGACGVPDAGLGPVELSVPEARALGSTKSDTPATGGAVPEVSPVWVPTDRRPTAPGRLGGGEAAGATVAARGRAAGAPDAA